MEKKIVLISVCILAFSFTNAQTNQFKKGQVDLNLGVGFITPFFDIDGADVKTKTPPITLALDYGITEVLSLGIYAGTAKSDVYQTLYSGSGAFYGKSSTLSHFLVGTRLLYHFELLPKIDTYGGAMLGYNSAKETAEPNVTLIGNDRAKGLTYSLLVGGRYRFSKTVGCFTELGYGVTIVNLGLNLKF